MIFNTLISAEIKARELSYEFLVAQETRDTYIDIDGKEKIRERRFIIFKNAKEFNLDKYQHCHEVVFERQGGCRGRLVFDFDIPFEDYTSTFESRIEKAVITTFQRFYTNIDTDRLEFVWLSSENPNKVSKHLVVKNALFEDWVNQIKYFYQSMKKVDDIEALDFQLARNRASLRLPLNAKINGNKLLFDNDNHCFFDGLIYPIHEDRVYEQRISRINQNRVLKLHIHSDVEVDEEKSKEVVSILGKQMWREQFKMGKKRNNRFPLFRIKPGKCPISGRIHDNENACLIVGETGKIIFHCYRGCKANNKSFVVIKGGKERMRYKKISNNLLFQIKRMT